MRLSREAKDQLDDIREGITLSSDDVGIARRFHIPLYEIQAIRQMMAEEEAIAPRKSPEEQASAELKERLDGLFSKWERKHQFVPGAGRILVPAGYQP